MEREDPTLQLHWYDPLSLLNLHGPKVTVIVFIAVLQSEDAGVGVVMSDLSDYNQVAIVGSSEWNKTDGNKPCRVELEMVEEGA